MRLIDLVDADSISHELKTPISVLMLQLELMECYIDDKQKLHGIASVASQNSNKIARTAENILDIIKIDANDIKVRLADQDIIAIIDDICKYSKPFAAAKSIELFSEIPLRSITMPVDVEKIRKIVLNLISNAIKYTGECGKIVVRIEDNQDKGVILSVEDTGEGIPEERLRFLFDRAPQKNPSLSRKSKGCGLGLILVKSYVEMLGGKITVTSKVSEGSKFSVELPIVEAPSDTNAIIFGLNLAKRVEIELSDLD